MYVRTPYYLRSEASLMPDDLRDLLLRYLAAREAERRANNEFIASINRGSTSSAEGRQALSDALLQLTRQTHTLYRALHLAATGSEAARYGRTSPEGARRDGE